MCGRALPALLRRDHRSLGTFLSWQAPAHEADSRHAKGVFHRIGRVARSVKADLRVVEGGTAGLQRPRSV